MENNIIPILESTVAEATSKCDIPWIWKLNKIHAQDALTSLTWDNPKRMENGRLFGVPIDPTDGRSCLICENEIYYVP